MGFNKIVLRSSSILFALCAILAFLAAGYLMYSGKRLDVDRDAEVSASTYPVSEKHHRDLPRALHIASVGINSDVIPEPTVRVYSPFSGKEVPSFGVPSDMYTTAWWSNGPAPGEDGMAIILGHTQVGGGYGVFNRLGELSRGDTGSVALSSGKLTTFSVADIRNGVRKDEPDALGNILRESEDRYDLALISCSGNFDEGLKVSEENIVVLALIQA